MKYCEECGTKLRNESEFCWQCGAPCPDIGDEVLYSDRLSAYRREQKNRDKKEEEKSAAPIVGTIIILALIGALMFYTWYSPARRSYQYAIEGRTTEARELYLEKVQGNVPESFLLRLMVPRGANAVVAAYHEGTLTYPDASERLRTLAELETPLNNAARAADKLESLNKSEEAWTYAANCEASGDYRSAMLAYRLVTKEDSRYDTAQQKAADMEKQYRSSVLTSIGVPENETDYSLAVASLESALAVLPNDQTLKDALATLKTNYAVRLKAQTVPVVTDYIAQGYYKQAIDLTKKALAYNEQDTDLKTLLAAATSNYEEFARGQVSIYLANNDKAGAAAFLDRVEADLPGDVVIQELRAAIT